MRLTPLLLSLCVAMHAAVLDARYDISYWFLGSIGTTTLHFESFNGRYRIEAEATLHGIAAVLAHHHTELHTSIGDVKKDGTLVPERYDVVRTMDGYRRVQHYYFDRIHQRILLQQRLERTVSETRFNPDTMRYETTDIPTTDTFTHIEPYYADEDFLTLYFNGGSALRQLPFGKTLRLKAVGSRNGIVTVRRDSATSEFVVLLDQDIFRSKKGELNIEMDNKLYIKRAVLKDVFLFGDLKAERIKLEQSP